MLGLGIGLHKNRFIGGGVSFDADYQAVLDYATTLGYTLPSAGQQVKQNQLIVDFKSAGVYSKFDALPIFANDGSSNFGLIDWKRLSLLTAVNSPTFVSNKGFMTNGVSSTISLNFNASTSGVNYQLNSASYGVFLYEDYIGGSFRAVNSDGLTASCISSDPLNRVGVNTNNNSTFTIPINGIKGLKSLDRSSSILTNSYENGVLLGVSTAVSTAKPTNFTLGRERFLFTSIPLSMFYAGASLTPTEHLAIQTIYLNYLDSL